MNDNFEYKSVFERIESSLKKNLNISIAEFQTKILPFKETGYLDFRNRSEKNIFWVFSYICFFGQGDKSRVIEKHFEDIRSLLCKDSNDAWYLWEIDYIWLANLPQSEKDGLIFHTLKFGRQGNTKNGNTYLRYIIDNAKKYQRIVRESSFANYVAEAFDMSQEEISKIDLKRYKIDDPEIKSLISAIKSFDGIGRITAPHLLGDLGFNVTKPDRVVCRILSRLGLLDNGLSDANKQDEAMRQINVFSEVTGHPSRYIDIIFAKYGQDGDSPLLGTKDGICAKKSPKCGLCDVIDICKYGGS